jgi:hypothetical protein
MIAFLVLNVMLLVYYVGRLITLYIGAILAPLVLLLWLLPAFKDFAITALKTYLATIFVLFVHVVILLLAASIFTGILKGDDSGQPSNLMALIVGMATLIALLKTQGAMQELSYAASTPRAAREMAGSFMRGVGYMNKGRRSVTKVVKSGHKAVTKGGSSNNKSGSGNPPTIVRMQQPTKQPTAKPKKESATPLKTGETRRAKPSETKK